MLTNWSVGQAAWEVPPQAKCEEALLERAKNEPWSLGAMKSELKEDLEEPDDMRRKGDARYVWRNLRMITDGHADLVMKLAEGDPSQCNLEKLIEDEAPVKKEEDAP